MEIKRTTDQFAKESYARSGGLFVLSCKHCRQIISGPLRQIQGPEQLRDEGGTPTLLPGCFAICGDLCIDEAYYGATASDVLVSLSDLLGLEEFGPRTGCCGPSDQQFNLRCKKGHTLGIEVGDCWTPHFVRFPIDRITLEPTLNVDC